MELGIVIRMGRQYIYIYIIHICFQGVAHNKVSIRSIKDPLRSFVWDGYGKLMRGVQLHPKGIAVTFLSTRKEEVSRFLCQLGIILDQDIPGQPNELSKCVHVYTHIHHINACCCIVTNPGNPIQWLHIVHTMNIYERPSNYPPSHICSYMFSYMFSLFYRWIHSFRMPYTLW